MNSPVFSRLLSLILTISVVVSPMASASEGNGTPIGEPTAVQGITLGAYTGTTTTLALSWSAPASNGGSVITGYSAVAMTGAEYTVESAATCSVNGTTLLCSLIGMAYGTSYKIRMIATNAVGPSVAAFSSTFTTPSIAQTVTISGAPTSVNFGAAPSQLSALSTVTGSDPVQPTGLTIAWSSSTTTICSIDNNGSVTYLAVGSCTVTATQDGSGSSYAANSASATITVGTTISATATGSSAITGTGATLAGSVPFPGTSTTVVFCLSTTNSNASCGSAGGSVSTASPATITAVSGSTTTAIVTGLTAGTTYYFWVEATGAGTTTKSSVLSFATLISPSLAQSGPTTGETGSAFSTTVTATSGSGVYTNWSANSLPAGLAISPNGSQAVISGTPTTAASTTSVITVTDSSGLSANISVTFVINAPPPPPPPPPAPTSPGEPIFDTTAPFESVEDRTKRIADAEAAAKKLADEAEAAKKLAEEEAAKKLAQEEAARIAAAEEARLGNPPGSTTPVLTPQGNLPSIPDSNSLIFVSDGQLTTGKFTVIESQVAQITFGATQLRISIQDSNSLTRKIAADNRLIAFRDDFLSLQGEGYTPGTSVTVWIFSTPIKLGATVVDRSGKLSVKLLITENIEIGPHTIQINGIDSVKKSFSVSLQALIQGRVANTEEAIDEAIKEELGTETGPGFTVPAFGRTITKGVLFTQKSATIVRYEKKVILTYRKILAKTSKTTCIGFTWAKKPTRSQIAIAKRQATAACKYLLPAKTAKFKILVRDIKLAKKTGRRTSVTKKYPVNIQITTPRRS